MKCGLDWFRIDVDFDDKVEFVCAEFGSAGLEVIVRLWQKIYKETGYYTEWNEEVALLFARKIAMSGNVVSEIVKCCIRRGLFNKNQYEENGILTSHGIQKWFFDSTERRKEIKVIERYLLVNVHKKSSNVNINAENVDKNSKNVNKNKHSTVQDSKVNYIYPLNPPKGERSVSFKKPMKEEVVNYCSENKLSFDIEEFLDFYESNGWKIGKVSMKDWKATARNWSRRKHSKQNINEVEYEKL